MAQRDKFISLGELLEEELDSEEDNIILGRLKLWVQEHLPEGWTNWRVVHSSKEEVVGESVDPQMLNKLRFALPTVEVVKAFLPDADHVSQKTLRNIKVKLLDWEFTRALIIGPPAFANRVRGSAAQTEIFNNAVASLKNQFLSQKEASRALSRSCSETSVRRKRRCSSSSGAEEPHRAKRSRVSLLEEKMDSMFEVLMRRMDSFGDESQTRRRRAQWSEASFDLDSGDESLRSLAAASPVTPNPSLWKPQEQEVEGQSMSSWKPPKLNLDLGLSPEGERQKMVEASFEFQPTVKEADPVVPEPDSTIKEEGIECHRFGSQSWNRVRYKEAEKSLLVSPVFSALKVNTELSTLEPASMTHLKKLDGMLGAIEYGILKERRALAEHLKSIATKFPEAAQDLAEVLADGSAFRAESDGLLQFACGHRTETFELRRKGFRTRNDILGVALHSIPPSATYLFEERALSVFIKDNGGAAAIFPSKYGRFPDRRAVGANSNSFRRPAPQVKSRQPSWRSQPTATMPSAASKAARYKGPAKTPMQSKKQRRLDREFDQHRQRNKRY